MGFRPKSFVYSSMSPRFAEKPIKLTMSNGSLSFYSGRAVVSTTEIFIIRGPKTMLLLATTTLLQYSGNVWSLERENTNKSREKGDQPLKKKSFYLIVDGKYNMKETYTYIPYGNS